MIDSPTVKALASTIVTFAVIFAVGTVTNAIGQNTAVQPTAPAANPYENVESETVAAHNHPDRSAPAADASHNTP